MILNELVSVKKKQWYIVGFYLFIFSMLLYFVNSVNMGTVQHLSASMFTHHWYNRNVFIAQRSGRILVSTVALPYVPFISPASEYF